MSGNEPGRRRNPRTHKAVPGGKIDYTEIGEFSLYRLYKNGDEKAFEELYRRFSLGLFNYLVRLMSDWHHAEDILVETFSKLAHSNLEEKGSLKAWLYRVATNQCYKLLRKRKGEVSFSEETFRQQINDPIPKVHEEVRIQRILSELPENQRVVVVLKFYDGMTYQEISDILHCPLGTVKSRMHEGIKKMRKVMEKRRRD